MYFETTKTTFSS